MSIDSALFVIETFIIKAQTIAVYSYTQNPYNHGSENIFKATSQSYLVGVIPRRYRYLRGPYLLKNGKSFINYRSSGQYSRDFSEREPGRNCDWRSRERQSKTKK